MIVQSSNDATSLVIDSLTNTNSGPELVNNNFLAWKYKRNIVNIYFRALGWKELEKIPYGKTVSYLDLSKQLGNIKAIRAVASANGKNPIWIIVPCHRVIGNDASLTGYAGGLHRKKWLLDHESPYKQQTLF